MKHIASLELSKKLHDGGFNEKTEYYHVQSKEHGYDTLRLGEPFLSWEKPESSNNENLWKLQLGEQLVGVYPAPDLFWDICIKYRHKLFGETKCEANMLGSITHKIINCLIEGDKEEAERIILDNLKLNK